MKTLGRAFLLIALAAAIVVPTDGAEKVIIDTDPGVDDAIAVIFAFNSPDLEILGLTSIFGNVETDLATANSLRLVEMSGKNIPVTMRK